MSQQLSKSVFPAMGPVFHAPNRGPARLRFVLMTICLVGSGCIITKPGQQTESEAGSESDTGDISSSSTSSTSNPSSTGTHTSDCSVDGNTSTTETNTDVSTDSTTTSDTSATNTTTSDASETSATSETTTGGSDDCQPRADQSLLYDSFEYAAIPVVRSTSNGDRYLWEYDEDHISGKLRPGSIDVGEPALFGQRSLAIQQDGPEGLFHVFLANLRESNGWHYLRDRQPETWQLDTYNRMRFWIKLSDQWVDTAAGRHNFHVGTYIRDLETSTNANESNGMHYYHYYNLQPTRAWQQVIVDTHPNHIRGASGNAEQGDKHYPVAENPGYNYFDLMTWFYFAGTLSDLSSYPARFAIDGIEFFRDNPAADSSLVYALHGYHEAETNLLYVSWNRHKDQHTRAHELVYAQESIYSLGWNAAVPLGEVEAEGHGGYNQMYFASNTLALSNVDAIYIGVRPVGETSFREIRVPIEMSCLPRLGDED